MPLQEKEVIATNSSHIVRENKSDHSLQTQCSYEEAGTRLIPHAAEAVKKGHFHFKEMKSEELWVGYGTGMKFIPIQVTAISPGSKT